MPHSLKYGLLVICFAAAIHPASAQTPLETEPYTPLSLSEKGTIFGKRIIAPSAFAKSAVMAGINQWRNSPEEWGQGMAGYGRRYAHKIATRGIENGIGFLTAAALHEDPRYFRSGQNGVWRRVNHALTNTITTHTDSGGRRVALWRISGNYGAQFVSNAWRPDRYTNVPDTLARGTTSIGYDAISNLLKEFWPDIRKRVFRR